jgi:nucleotide-binding universal stress UspA family protein
LYSSDCKDDESDEEVVDLSSNDQLKRALVCIGPGEIDRDALSFVKKFSEAYHLTPVLFHVSQADSSVEDTEKHLAQIQNTLAMESIELRIIEGKLIGAIQNELNRQAYVVVIVGTTDRSPNLHPSRLSQKIANDIQVSILILRNPPPQIKRVLVCTGGHPNSIPAITWGITLARETKLELTILHVVSTTPAMYTGLPALEEDLSRILSRDSPLAHHLKEVATLAEDSDVKASIELRHGIVAEEILRSSEIKSHDLVILGAPAKQALFNRLVYGRIAPKLLASTLTSTLIVRGKIE